MKLYGFSILENALKENTCFRESVASLSGMVDETHVFIKNSVDGTEKALARGNNCHLHTLESGEELKVLQTLRESCENIPDAWCLFLRPDEVLNIDDLELLKKDIKRASERCCDAICFRNLNFAMTPHQISISSIGKGHSIRLFRLGADQYFEREELFDDHIYYSEVKLYHYLFLREMKEGLSKVCFPEKELLAYLGKHPLLMKRRVENWGGVWSRLEMAKVYILGDAGEFCTDFIQKIRVKKIIWVKSIVEIPPQDRLQAVILRPSLFQKVFRSSKVPIKMKSKESRDWSKEFLLILKLSEKGMAVD